MIHHALSGVRSGELYRKRSTLFFFKGNVAGYLADLTVLLFSSLQVIESVAGETGGKVDYHEANERAKALQTIHANQKLQKVATLADSSVTVINPVHEKPIPSPGDGTSRPFFFHSFSCSSLFFFIILCLYGCTRLRFGLSLTRVSVDPFRGLWVFANGGARRTAPKVGGRLSETCAPKRALHALHVPLLKSGCDPSNTVSTMYNQIHAQAACVFG